MSVDINWETLTGGPDGVALAENIRAFVHDRFQKVTLPRMIRSVHVHSFDFGSIAPTIELKDVCDPLPDFYEDEENDEDDVDVRPETDGSPNDRSERSSAFPTGEDQSRRSSVQHQDRDRDQDQRADIGTTQRNAPPPFINLRLDGLRPGPSRNASISSNAGLSRTTAPGILGGTSNLGYFHLPLSAGLSGTSTPLAAVAGAQFQNQWPEAAHHTSSHYRSTSFGSITPPSTNNDNSRPTSQHQQEWSQSQFERSMSGTDGNDSTPPSTHGAEREKSADDIQIVSHISYSGNVRLSLTAEILLDYPMPSFVGIPLQLNITGLTFDGVAILAYIKKKAHFCFLCPEDAEALVGGDVDLSMSSDADDTSSNTSAKRSSKVGGLLEEIKVESEIGQKESGKQVLKNVGKVEKFVLEQVRRIFEDEFVYPSFWTFLV